ncbi:16S rRNA processing protein RimM [Agrococcus jejuensis]|uniref:Ribosome maturation factor RimM n=1 Tax=Agrococcus jejuensis TaxID=399736 RepID=A0A1G8GI94_9MICO|nr:16S rRNA processing protein RimM [Agrococcus jejuensis]
MRSRRGAASASTWWTPIPERTRTQLRVGRLVKAHGLKGALKIELYTDEPERRFTAGAEFSLQVPTSSKWHRKTLTMTDFKVFNGNPVGFFEGIDDRSEAETLVKAVLWVEQDATELPTEPDAWYQHQLANLEVWRDGVMVGRIARIDPMPAQDLLVIANGDTEVLLPFVRAFVPTVDLQNGRVEITPPNGLFEDPDPADAEPEPQGAGRRADAAEADADAPAGDEPEVPEADTDADAEPASEADPAKD